MPTAGYVAMMLGVVFSIVVGCGLMALIFYSSRYGYDEPSHEEPRPSQTMTGRGSALKAHACLALR